MATVPILDTHQHLIYPERSAYAWAQTLPPLAGRPFRLDDYAAAAAGTGITHALFMETAPDDWRAENAWVAPLLDRPGSPTVGLVSNCRPESPDLPAWLDACTSDARVVGLRRVCHVEPDELSRSEVYRENVRRIGRAGLAFDLCYLARQLPVAGELAAACPDVRFVLDHCGIPNVAGRELDPWRGDLSRLAELPNVCCKLSGLLAYCRPDDATLDAVRPFAEHAIACFGPNRMAWGGDWPVVNLTSSLHAWVDVTQRLLADHTPAEQRAVLFDTAVDLYGLDRRGLLGTQRRAST